MKQLLFLFILFPFFSFAQLLEDSQTQTELIKGLDKLYNLEFNTADTYFSPIKARYRQHPLYYLLEAIEIQWKNLPIEENPKALNQYLASLESCRVLAMQLAQKPDYKAEATFFLLASHGYMALASNYKKDYLKAVNQSRLAYGYLKDGFKFMKENPDFYYTTGVYNFYRIQYPITHPIVKPLMPFFENGNKSLGIQQLQLASTKAIFTRVEALLVLTNLYLKYEKNFVLGLQYAAQLYKKYPNNYTFRIRYVEALLFMNKFDEAQALIPGLLQKGGDVNNLSANFFSGYAAEIHQKNDKLAAKLYADALKYKPNGRYTDDYYAMACLGLGRIMERINDKEKARYFYKRCAEYAQYTWVVADVTEKLKNL